MKHIILLAVCLLSSFLAHSQNLLKDQKIWKTQHYEWVGDSYSYSSYKIIGDSIIGDKTYSKLYMADGTTQNYSNLVVLLREEGGIVYQKYADDSEKILYNFSLEVDELYSLDEDCAFKVNQIDSVQFGTEIKYERLVMETQNGGNQTFDIVNGIGSFIDLLTPYYVYCLTDANLKMYCVIEDGEIIYEHPQVSCDIDVSTNSIEVSNINIFPNPSLDGFVSIESIDPSIEMITVFDHTGKQIEMVPVLSDQIDLTIVHRGLYFLQFSTTTGVVGQRRLIVM